MALLFGPKIRQDAHSRAVYFSTLRCHLHVAQQDFDRIANFDAQPPIFTVKDLPIQPIADMKPNLPSGTVTFLFTDIESSTKLWERYPEAMKAALARHDAILHEVVEAHHGRIIKTMGDSIHAVFGSAASGVAAALTAQRALFTEGWEGIKPQVVRVRMGLHTCEAEARAGDYYGPALNRAARLMSIGYGGQTLLSTTTANLVRDQLPVGASLCDLGEHRLKDLVRSERIYQLIHPDLPVDFPPLKSLNAFRNNLPVQLTSFIGRQAEVKAGKDLLMRECAPGYLDRSWRHRKDPFGAPGSRRPDRSLRGWGFLC